MPGPEAAAAVLLPNLVFQGPSCPVEGGRRFGAVAEIHWAFWGAAGCMQGVQWVG